MVLMNQFADATNYSGFSGGVYQSLNEKAAKEKWIAGMEKLRAEGVEFTGHRDISIITDDRFTSGYVTLSIKYEKEDYSFRVFVSTNSGKVELGGLSNDVKFQYREPSDKEKMLIKKISEVMTTYNPG